MTNPERPTSTDPSFEENYGWFVMDLVLQSRMPCHDRAWVTMAARQLTDAITEASGLDRDQVREQLNDLWKKVQETGTQAYLEQWGASVTARSEHVE